MKPAIDPKQLLARISKLVVLSYAVDWVFIIGVALIGYGFYEQEPNHHPFSLSDPTISFPYTENETVTTKTLILVSIFAPAVIILLAAWAIVPGTAAPAGAKPSVSQVLRRKFWEWNAGWMGLAVALAGAWMSTQGLKVLIGKPRPDLLSRCNPDLSNIADYAVGGLGGSVRNAPVLVSWDICQVKTSLVKIDGFSSFPSGHSSFAFAGLGYLTLWFAAKFSVGFPYLSTHPVKDEIDTEDRLSVRARGAAPPVLMMVLAFVPTATACFIAASRWFDFRHHGFDILFGSAIGIFFAWFGFRMYHLPINRGAGWAWGPRTSRRAFVRGFGFPSTLGTDSWSYSRNANVDYTSNGYHEEAAVENGTFHDGQSQLPMTERV